MTRTGIYDAAAEACVAGCAVASTHGAQLAAGRLTAGQFRDPRYRRLFTAALDCPLGDQDDRIWECARDAHQHPTAVAELVSARPVQWDTAGSYAARVAAAADRRRNAASLLAQLEDLGLTIHATELAL